MIKTLIYYRLDKDGNEVEPHIQTMADWVKYHQKKLMVDTDKVWVVFRAEKKDTRHPNGHVVPWHTVVEDGNEHVLHYFMSKNKESKLPEVDRPAYQNLQRLLSDDCVMARHRPPPVEAAPQRLARESQQKEAGSRVLEVFTLDDELVDHDMFDSQESICTYSGDDPLEKDKNLLDDDDDDATHASDLDY